jgi:Fe-S cluster assembly protein SufD
MNKPTPEQMAFYGFAEETFLRIKNGDPLQKMREKAWNQFIHVGLPNQHNEAFRHIKLKHLFSMPFQSGSGPASDFSKITSYIYPECARSYLVFMNGQYRPDLSNITALPKKIMISPLSDAMRTYGTLLNNHWTKSLKEETDPFAILNAALQKGTFIYLPPNTCIEPPIQLLYFAQSMEQCLMITPRVQLFAGQNSEAKIISTYATSSSAPFFFNHVCEAFLEEGAHMHYMQMAHDLSSEWWFFDAFRCVLKKNSSLKTIKITNGALSSRHDYKIALTGENAEAQVNGLSMLSEKREAHTNVLMEHQAPRCRSMQMFKGILTDFSRSSFEGKILVQQDAQKTEAFQLNNNLLLHDHVTANSKPNLEIFADDVKASHGATVGRLDEESLFYLKTRGLTEEVAKNLLIYSFSKEVIDLIPISTLQQQLARRAQNYL